MRAGSVISGIRSTPETPIRRRSSTTCARARGGSPGARRRRCPPTRPTCSKISRRSRARVLPLFFSCCYRVRARVGARQFPRGPHDARAARRAGPGLRGDPRRRHAHRAVALRSAARVRAAGGERTDRTDRRGGAALHALGGVGVDRRRDRRRPRASRATGGAAAHAPVPGLGRGAGPAARERRREGDSLDEAVGEGRDAIFAYFASEIFVRARPQNQRALMLAALAPSVTAPEAVAITGGPGRAAPARLPVPAPSVRRPPARGRDDMALPRAVPRVPARPGRASHPGGERRAAGIVAARRIAARGSLPTRSCSTATPESGTRCAR